jgi:hypothetical protein
MTDVSLVGTDTPTAPPADTQFVKERKNSGIPKYSGAQAGIISGIVLAGVLAIVALIIAAIALKPSSSSSAPGTNVITATYNTNWSGATTLSNVAVFASKDVTTNIVTLNIRAATAAQSGATTLLIASTGFLDAPFKPAGTVALPCTITAQGINEVLGGCSILTDGSIGVGPIGNNSGYQVFGGFPLGTAPNTIGWADNLLLTYNTL